MGLFKKLFGGLKKTATAISSGIAGIFKGKELNDEFYEDLETILISADIGIKSTSEIIEDIKTQAKQQHIKTEEELKQALAKSIEKQLTAAKPEFKSPSVIMVVGVNGVGKTTSIGKVANWFKSQKKNVLIVAADTFRAAATEQVDMWATRSGVRIVKQKEGADPSAVVFDGLVSAKAKCEDVILIDTAGRLHNKTHLMEELKKMDRVIKKAYPEANVFKMLVLDATTGQNALSQVEYFNQAVGIDGIILTKLDGTAKGGVVVAINREQHMPVVFVGVGEKMEDLELFDAKTFAESLVGIE